MRVRMKLKKTRKILKCKPEVKKIKIFQYKKKWPLKYRANGGDIGLEKFTHKN